MAPPTPAFDARHVSPPDAAVTLRSLRRRFAEAFDQAETEKQVTTPDRSGVSPLGRAAWVTDALSQIGAALRGVFFSENPTIQLPPPDPPTPVGAADVASVLARLGETAGAVADQIAEVHGEDWNRSGLANGATVTALDIARLGVGIAIDQLRAAETAIGAGRR